MAKCLCSLRISRQHVQDRILMRLNQLELEENFLYAEFTTSQSTMLVERNRTVFVD